MEGVSADAHISTGKDGCDQMGELGKKCDSEIIYSHIRADDFVRISINGMIYETLKATLSKFPNTLLGNENRRQNHYVSSKKAYFFNRNRNSFQAILYYYQSGGLLVRPKNVPLNLFVEEVKYFELGKEAMETLRETEGYIMMNDPKLPERQWQRKIWKILEFSDSSMAARITAMWSVLVILLSIVVFVIETIPEIEFSYVHDETHTDDFASEKERRHLAYHTSHWFYIELFCVIWFTFEYLIRFAFSPDKILFLRSILNIIDIAAVLPYYILLMAHAEHSTPISILRLARVLRVFRIFKLYRHSFGLQILGQTVMESLNELVMLIFFLTSGIILFSSAIYYAEYHVNPRFSSIPNTFWYTVVTMATLGYGDQVPKTDTGKFVGGICALSGVMTVGLVVPIIASNFEFLYKTRLEGDKLDFFRLDTSEEEAN